MNLINYIVAHRGDHYQAPENSLLAMQKALNSGALFFEFDVQLTQDQAPIMLHDDNLLRTSGEKISVFKSNAKTLCKYSIHEPDKFGKKYYPQYLATLRQAVNLFNAQTNSSKLTVFVEIKNESINYFGVETILKAINNELIDAKFKVVVISYHYKFIQLAQQKFHRVGWVNDYLNDEVLIHARSLQPNYVFCKTKTLLNYKIKSEFWQWVAYVSNNIDQIQALLNHGVDLIETDKFTKLTQE